MDCKYKRGSRLVWLTEYLELWDMLVGVTLNDNEDAHKWKPEASGLFSTRSTYRSFFIGSSTLNLGRKYGSQGYLGNAKHLCGWLFGIIVGLHIVYKKEVFLILSIALSATRRRKTFNTSLSHVLLQLARQFWYAILQPINLSRLTPTRSVNNFPDWWKHAERRLPKQHRKGFNSLCTWGLDPLEA